MEYNSLCTAWLSRNCRRYSVVQNPAASIECRRLLPNLEASLAHFTTGRFWCSSLASVNHWRNCTLRLSWIVWMFWYLPFLWSQSFSIFVPTRASCFQRTLCFFYFHFLVYSVDQRGFHTDLQIYQTCRGFSQTPAKPIFPGPISSRPPVAAAFHPQRMLSCGLHRYWSTYSTYWHLFALLHSFWILWRCNWGRGWRGHRQIWSTFGPLAWALPRRGCSEAIGKSSLRPISSS